MEGEKKGNTAMLTVIAIATLLVAVVGATFAYFSASTGNTSGAVTVEATTANAGDVFTAIGEATLSLSITADKMQQQNPGSDLVAVQDQVPDATSNPARGSITVSLTAGSGNARCEYDLYYYPTTAFTPTPAAVTANKAEYTIDGTGGSNTFTGIDVSGAGTGNPAKILLKEDAVITDAYTAAEGTNQSATQQQWTFTAKFYNLDLDQTENVVGQSFGGQIKVEGVECSNSTTP